MRLLLILFLFSSCFPLAAASWSPSISAYTVYSGTVYSSSIDPASPLRNAFSVRAELDALAVSEGIHRFSMPLAISVTGASGISGRRIMLTHYDASLSLQYGIDIAKHITLSVSADIIFSIHEKNDGVSARAGGTIKAGFSPLSWLSILFPVSYSYGNMESSFTAGAGFAIFPGGRA